MVPTASNFNDGACAFEPADDGARRLIEERDAAYYLRSDKERKALTKAAKLKKRLKRLERKNYSMWAVLRCVQQLLPTMDAPTRKPLDEMLRKLRDTYG